MRRILYLSLALALAFATPSFAARVGSFVADEPFRAYAAVTTSDATTYGIPGATNPRPIEALYIGVTGDVSLVGQDQATAAVFKAVPAGTVLFVSPYQIKATGTTATNILALYR